MNNLVYLRPGTPNDDNREYLPESIKGSDMVVNENENNSIPYPEGLEENHGVLVDDGIPDTWYVYVPKTYDPSKKTPLIFGMHGGLMTGWGHAIYTSWTLVADREGFICVFPDANKDRMWQVEGVVNNDTDIGLPIISAVKDVAQTHDTKMVFALIELMKEKYNIDEGRIFMQGMSMGNFMTGQFARYYGNILAGAAGSGGPCRLKLLFESDGTIKNQGGPLAIWQSRPEKNGLPPKAEYDESLINKYNRFYWMLINECDPIPEIRIIGEDNLAFYKGKKADLTYLDIKNRDHGQTLEEAFLYWDYMFSGVHREPDGTVTQGETRLPRIGDEFAAAFTPGVARVWWKNTVVELSTAPILWQKLKYHGLNGGQKVRGEYLCVPLAFLAEMAGAQYIPSEDTLTAKVLLPDGGELQFARGSIGCVVDDSLRSMYCETLHRNGELFVSCEWFCKYFLNLSISTCNDVVYVTDHFADLSFFMADLIKDILNGMAEPEKWLKDGFREF